MNDTTAAAVNWLAQGRTAPIVAPTIRAATAPQTHRAMRRMRRVADTVTTMDPTAAQRALMQLGSDRRFRHAVDVAAHRIELAASQGRRRRRRRWLGITVAAMALTAVAVRVMRSPQAGGSAPVAEPMPVDMPAG